MISQNEILNSEIFDFQLFAIEEVEKLQKQSFGDPAKKLLIVLFDTSHLEELMPFLQKIMEAVKYNLQKDARLLKLTNEQSFSCFEFCRKNDLETVLFFGQNPQQVGLNLNIKKYHPIHFAEKIFLFSDDLKAIHADANLKKQLWSCLQQMFLK